jgi:hypothetical protein
VVAVLEVVLTVLANTFVCVDGVVCASFELELVLVLVLERVLELELALRNDLLLLVPLLLLRLRGTDTEFCDPEDVMVTFPAKSVRLGVSVQMNPNSPLSVKDILAQYGQMVDALKERAEVSTTSTKVKHFQARIIVPGPIVALGISRGARWTTCAVIITSR